MPRNKNVSIQSTQVFNPMAVWARDNEIGVDETPFIQHFDRLDADRDGHIIWEESMPKHRKNRSDEYAETEFEPQ